GPVRVIDVPRPTIGPTEVLVRTTVSLISPGTERAVTRLAQSGLLTKARARPDLVRKVMEKARTEGVVTAARAVRDRLSDDVPLGYSAAGIAAEVGEAVAGVSPGQLVATGGAGKASHAEFQAVPGLLCVPVPGGVAPADAAFATLASVALHGLRLADVGPGARVVVIGLGVMGQLAVRLAEAAGCHVAGIDVAEPVVARTTRSTGALALVDAGQETSDALADWSRGRGADAVLVAAATSSSDAVMRAASVSRDRATVVVLGDVGLDLDRRPFYEKELTIRFSRSYGPGRHEQSYEDWGVDVPSGLVRWTEGRNLEAVLDLLSAGRFQVADLVTHAFRLDDAPAAYELIESGAEPSCAVQLIYPDTAGPDRPVTVSPRGPGETLGVGLIGAGAFARGTLVPALKAAGFGRLVSVASSSGLSARQLAESAGFEQAAAGADAVIHDPDIEVVVVATRHDSHATMTAAALRASKHVFCEKPLALSEAELDDVELAWREGTGELWIGFNRRWSTPVAMVADHFRSDRRRSRPLREPLGPLVVTYRVNAGRVAADHWYNDRRQGGRLLGEVCHFVDTCSAIVGLAPVGASARGSGRGERLLSEDLVVSLEYADGSVAAITYASGGRRGVEKERIEVLGRGRSAAIVDFRTVVLDGASTRFRSVDKGHRRQMAEFRRAVLGAPGIAADASPTEEMLASSRVTLIAAATLTGA
ncbi:MAG TPA: bi-domain-containing oxidoreductase, partial [Acidimicrobiales bacterium]|nr:bi-domain-containing oxidoreductase [Acidimicrobiales bacterium]